MIPGSRNRPGSRYRSFTVASAIADSIAVISQNRTTTFGPPHPLFRKVWGSGAIKRTPPPSPYRPLVYLNPPPRPRTHPPPHPNPPPTQNSIRPRPTTVATDPVRPPSASD